MYTDFINEMSEGNQELMDSWKEYMYELEECVNNLLIDDDVYRYIMFNFLYFKILDGEGHFQLWHVGKSYPHDDVIQFVKKDIDNDVGAEKLWKGFNFTHDNSEDLKEMAVYGFILSLCCFKVTQPSCLLYSFPSEPIEKISLKEKAETALGNSILGNLLGIPGLGLLARFENWENKRKLEKKKSELEVYAWKNPVDEVMKEEKFQILRIEASKKFNDSIVNIKFQFTNVMVPW